MTPQELLAIAQQARQRAYVPYSHFAVGAALLTKSGKVYPGCNIENASFGATNCAERTAFFSAVAQGERDFAAIAIVGGPQGGALDYTAPCGVCRQVMMEFCDPDTFRILVARSPEDYRVFTLRELMPQSFGPADLAKKS